MDMTLVQGRCTGRAQRQLMDDGLHLRGIHKIGTQRPAALPMAGNGMTGIVGGQGHQAVVGVFSLLECTGLDDEERMLDIRMGMPAHVAGKQPHQPASACF